VDVAGEAFGQAEALEREIDSSVQYLYSLRGIHHAEHLRRVGQADYARRVTAANLEICEQERWPDDTSHCHRVLGQLDADEGQTAAAQTHFDTALTIARGISKRDVLIEALLARGQWAARLSSPDLTGLPNLSGLLAQAFSDLHEALGYATDSGYRIYEADSRIALAWAHLAAQEATPARQEATRAQTMSQEMGYQWGQVDAAEVLAALVN
jgi:tetratricopeptide (TPR) repeat protein